MKMSIVLLIERHKYVKEYTWPIIVFVHWVQIRLTNDEESAMYKQTYMTLRP